MQRITHAHILQGGKVQSLVDKEWNILNSTPLLLSSTLQNTEETIIHSYHFDCNFQTSVYGLSSVDTSK